MDTRIGYPNEHLAEDSIDELSSPTFATGIGLVIEGFHRYDIENRKASSVAIEEDEKPKKPRSGSRRSFLDKIQEFFDQDGENIS